MMEFDKIETGEIIYILLNPRNRKNKSDAALRARAEALKELNLRVPIPADGVTKKELINAATEMQRPSVLFRPRVSQDGNEWLAILGDLPTGVVGCGSTPAEAMADFDRAWHKKAQTPAKENDNA